MHGGKGMTEAQTPQARLVAQMRAYADHEILYRDTAVGKQVQEWADELEALPASESDEKTERVQMPMRQVDVVRPVCTPVRATPRPFRDDEAAALPQPAEREYQHGHKPGCPVNGGYGHGPEPCICGVDQAAQPAEAWQLIETAPKDGTRLLLARKQFMSGEWVMVSGHWNSGDTFNLPHWSTMRTMHDPTHWMPLPPPPSTTSVDKTKRGLYRKFNVSRTDGSSESGGKHDGCNYFVLDVTHDKYAGAALRAYADSCVAEYPLLAADLHDLASKAVPVVPPPPSTP